jgi:hypothetical protein
VYAWLSISVLKNELPLLIIGTASEKLEATSKFSAH